MKAVLISINPKWCREIKSGKKTVEIRKAKPNMILPLKCYIYETKGRTWQNKNEPKMQEGRGAVIGEFSCYNIVPIEVLPHGSIRNWMLYSLAESCVPYEEMAKYIGYGTTGYGWKIAELKIYDDPKPLSKFGLNRPPQSWQYVEV